MKADTKISTESENPDISREGFTFQKGTHFAKVVFSRRATQVLDAVIVFENIDFGKLWESEKRGLILDVDECIAPHHGEILPKNAEILEGLIRRGFKIVIFSNMKKSGRYGLLEKLGIQVITSKFAKPDARGFHECLKVLGMEGGEAVMIGDNYLTDGGCRYAGIDFIKVKPVESPGAKKTFSRSAQILFRRMIDFQAEKIHHTLSYR